MRIFGNAIGGLKRPGLALSGIQDDVEGGAFRECPEIAVACEKRNVSIDAALGNERVTETRLAALFQNERSFLSTLDRSGSLRSSVGDRNHYYLPVFERFVEQLRIVAKLTLQEGYPGACVSRNHRSVFSSADVREKRTLPRNWRSRA